MTKKEIFCTNCGKKFAPTGREHICPACKATAAAAAKRAAVERAKMRSYTGEACPVRISGRASTVIRAYGKVHNLPFAAALDALLQASAFAARLGDWKDIMPYKSRRRDKSTATSTTETEQEVTGKPQEVKPVKQAAKKAVKTTGKAAGKAASKASASKASASKK